MPETKVRMWALWFGFSGLSGHWEVNFPNARHWACYLGICGNWQGCSSPTAGRVVLLSGLMRLYQAKWHFSSPSSTINTLEMHLLMILQNLILAAAQHLTKHYNPTPPYCHKETVTFSWQITAFLKQTRKHDAMTATIKFYVHFFFKRKGESTQKSKIIKCSL